MLLVLFALALASAQLGPVSPSTVAVRGVRAGAVSRSLFRQVCRASDTPSCPTPPPAENAGNWTNVLNLATGSAPQPSFTFTSHDSSSPWLTALNFAALAGVPPAQVTGVRVELDVAASSNGVRIPVNGVRLVTSTNVITALDAAIPNVDTAVPTTRGTLTFGGATELWRAGTASVQTLSALDATVGWAVAFQSNVGATVSVDVFALRVTVFGTFPTSTSTTTSTTSTSAGSTAPGPTSSGTTASPLTQAPHPCASISATVPPGRLQFTLRVDIPFSAFQCVSFIDLLVAEKFRSITVAAVLVHAVRDGSTIVVLSVPSGAAAEVNALMDDVRARRAIISPSVFALSGERGRTDGFLACHSPLRSCGSLWRSREPGLHVGRHHMDHHWRHSGRLHPRDWSCHCHCGRVPPAALVAQVGILH